MAVAQGACPNCGAAVQFALGSSIARVCEYCRHTIVRSDRGLENLGKAADLAATPSLLEVGDAGTIAGRPFSVFGRVQLDRGDGPWDEYYVGFDGEQSWGWLAYAQGEWLVTQLVPPVPAPGHAELQPEQAVPLGTRGTFLVAEVKAARITALEGELPGGIRLGATRFYADLSGRELAFATLDYGESQVGTATLFIGVALSEGQLAVSIAGPRTVQKVKTAQLTCPNCGGDVPKLSGDRAERLGCPYCGAISDIALRRVVAKQERQLAEPTIPIGKVGTLQGQGYVCIAYLRRGTRFDGELYEWEEYLLFNESSGFRWLVSDPETGWLWVKPLHLGDLDLSAPSLRVGHRGRPFYLRNQGEATVSYVIGEVYWKCNVGERVQVADYASGRDVISRERSAHEARYGLSSPVPWSVVARAFGIETDRSRSAPSDVVAVTGTSVSLFDGSRTSLGCGCWGLASCWCSFGARCCLPMAAAPVARLAAVPATATAEACFTVASDSRGIDARFGAWFPAFLMVLGGAWHEICIRQTDAYLGPGLSAPRGQSVAIAAIVGVFGALCGRRALLRAERRGRLVSWLAAATSVVCSASGGLWFFGFASTAGLAVVGLALPGVASFVCGATLGALGQAGMLAYRELGSLRLLLGPISAALVTLTLVAALTLASHLGLWRAAVGVGLLTAYFAGSVSGQRHYLSALDAPSPAPALLAAVLGTGSLITAQTCAPARLTSQYPSELVWCDRSGEIVVISAQNTFELFEAGQLRTSSADAYRFAELAVHPTLSAAPSRKRVLVLGPAAGFLEREVLRYASVRELVSVHELDTAPLRGSAWPAADGPLVDPRARFVTAEPLPWLEQHPETFDAIVVSLSPPESHHEGKYATRYFFRLLRERLTSRGLVALEVAPLAQTPRTFASTWQSLSDAGFSVASYEAPVPLLGALSFLVGRPSDFRHQTQELPKELRFLSQAQLPLLSTLPPTERAEPSTLDHQRAVELWHQEQAALGN